YRKITVLKARRIFAFETLIRREALGKAKIPSLNEPPKANCLFSALQSQRDCVLQPRVATPLNLSIRDHVPLVPSKAFMIDTKSPKLPNERGSYPGLKDARSRTLKGFRQPR